ncbi:MAG TPA: hypothetical protein VLH18_01805, partial [Candidatus Limnocylindrales bacterium]|nr:hypothetical protein [Candidatus Limnocylindrales bacterium]
TKTGAEFIAAKLDAELIELVETEERGGITGFLKSGYQAASKKKSELKGEPWKQIERHTKLYLLTPIWAGNGTPAMSAFLDKADFTGKEVIVATFQYDQKGSGSAKVHAYMKEKIESGGGKYLKGIALHGAPPGKFAGMEYIQMQTDKILQSQIS